MISNLQQNDFKKKWMVLSLCVKFKKKNLHEESMSAYKKKSATHRVLTYNIPTLAKSVFWKASVFSMIVFPEFAFSLSDSVFIQDNEADRGEISSQEGDDNNADTKDELESENKVEETVSTAPQVVITKELEDSRDKKKIFFRRQRVANVADSKQPAKTPATNTPSKAALHSRLEIGGNYTYVTLKPHDHQTFTGNLGGIQALYEYRPANRFYGGVEFSWREGDTHSAVGKRSLLYFDVQERFGYTLASAQEAFRLTLFSGFAYRYLGETFKPKYRGSLSFGYNEFYFPVGFLSCYRANSVFSFGVDFTWMPQVYTTVSIVPLKGARWVITNRLDNFLVEAPFTFTLTKNNRLLLILKPSYQYWKDGHSTAKLRNGIALGLPGNTYNFYGVDLTLGYSF
jgi:hypothetical protein